MIFCIVFLGGLYYWWKNLRPALPGIGAQPGAAWPDRAKHPLVLRDDVLEKQMRSQQQTTVRMPFGAPNAYQRTILDPILLTNPNYQKEYQNIMRETQIDTVNWKIDPLFNSPLNNTPGSQHIPENMIRSISNWSHKREIC
jgi:hypothetical protein